MLNINCPECGQQLEASKELVGNNVECYNCTHKFVVELPKTKECDFCGEEILYKAKKCKHCGEFLDGSVRPQHPQQVIIEQPVKKKQEVIEKDILRGHSSHMNYILPHIICIALWFLAGIGLIGTLYFYLKAKSVKYRLTNKRLYFEQGILSKQTNEVMIRDIRSVNLKQPFLDKLFNLGTLEIGTAGTAGIEIALVGIPGPVALKSKIQKLQNDL